MGNLALVAYAELPDLPLTRQHHLTRQNPSSVPAHIRNNGTIAFSVPFGYLGYGMKKNPGIWFCLMPPSHIGALLIIGSTRTSRSIPCKRRSRNRKLRILAPAWVVKGENNIFLGDAALNQILSNAQIRTVVLKPHFIVHNINMHEYIIYPSLTVPANLANLIVSQSIVADEFCPNICFGWGNVCDAPKRALHAIIHLQSFHPCRKQSSRSVPGIGGEGGPQAQELCIASAMASSSVIALPFS